MLLSVCMITYNHAEYIGQAIDSVLSQKTNFQIELVIGEDCSTDNTRKICLAYREKYPDIIKLRLPDKNMGMMPNFIENLKACKGKYIALLEGDDYWTDPLKLQKQVDFLEASPDYVMCFHNVKFENSDGGTSYTRDICKVKKNTYTFEDFCADTPMAYTSSLVYRNNLFPEFPSIFNKCGVGDWPLKVLVSEHGKTKYMDEVMSFYRIHPGGVWSMAGLRNSEKILLTIKTLNEYYKGNYKSFFYKQNRMLAAYWDAYICSCEVRQFKKSIYYMSKIFLLLRFKWNNPYKITRGGTLKKFILAVIKQPSNTPEKQVK